MLCIVFYNDIYDLLYYGIPIFYERFLIIDIKDINSFIFIIMPLIIIPTTVKFFIDKKIKKDDCKLPQKQYGLKVE